MPAALRSVTLRSAALRSVTLRSVTLHAGMAVATVGLFLPWSRIGGRTRSGFETANVLLSLAANGLPGGAAWVARAWYVGAAAGLAAWGAATLAESSRVRHMALLLGGTAVAAMAVAVVSAHRLAGVGTRWTGPTAALVGLGSIVLATAQGRQRERHLAG